MTVEGRAFVFGDEVNTDLIMPHEYLGEPPSVVAEHAFEPIREDFGEEVEAGDVIVAGEHFGSGSAREAPSVLKATGTGAVVAESFSRLFYRNAIAVGLPAFISPAVTDVVTEGDTVEIDLDDQAVLNRTTGASNPYEPLPDMIRTIFDEGGLLEYHTVHPEGLQLE